MTDLGALAERWAQKVMGKEHAEKVRIKVEKVVTEVKETKLRGETIPQPPSIPEKKKDRPYLGVDLQSGAFVKALSTCVVALWTLVQLA